MKITKFLGEKMEEGSACYQGQVSMSLGCECELRDGAMERR